MKQNDDKILGLKDQIAKKKELLKSSKKFTPITNCNLIMGTERVNLHTLSSKDAIMEVMVRVNMVRLSVNNLGFDGEYKIGGYLVDDWMNDLTSKLNIVNRTAEEAKLKAMESKLTKLLSLDKQTELEIAQIEEMLKS